VNDIKEKAIKLRLDGYSYNEISKKLIVAKSTLYGWLCDVVLSKKAINRLPYGTVQVIVCDTQMFYCIMGFIEGVKEQLQKYICRGSSVGRASA